MNLENKSFLCCKRIALWMQRKECLRWLSNQCLRHWEVVYIISMAKEESTAKLNSWWSIENLKSITTFFLENQDFLITKAKFNDGFHFGHKDGFRIKISTLGKTQMKDLAQFLGLSEDAFKADRLINGDHSHKFWDGRDIDSQLQMQSNSTRVVAVGDVQEISYRQSVEVLFKHAFGDF